MFIAGWIELVLVFGACYVMTDRQANRQTYRTDGWMDEQSSFGSLLACG